MIRYPCWFTCAVLLLSACGTDAESPQGSAPTVNSALPVPTSSWKQGDPVNAYYVEGALVSEGDCIRLRRDDGGTIVTPVWPEGYSARHAPDGELELLSMKNVVVARTGDHVHLDGGYATHFPKTQPCLDPGDGELFLVQELL